jgi:GH24 family phage-related lysozyme (muramidase)
MAEDWQLKVEQIFSGTNYLETLATSNSIYDISKVLGGEGNGSLVSSAPESIFNKFSIFQYSKFRNGLSYEPAGHFIGFLPNRTNTGEDDAGNLAATKQIENQQGLLRQQAIVLSRENKTADLETLQKQISDNVTLLELKRADIARFQAKNTPSLANPTAKTIIEWGATKSGNSVTGFQPYSMTDFMFCKNYGKIPNNRMITLRRYPFPVEDQLTVPGQKHPIPVAQAVTWWGENTGNSLSKLGVMKWNLKWSPVEVKQQDIEGNEVLVDDLVKMFESVPGLKGKGAQLKKAYVGLKGNDKQLQQLSGMEKKMQDFLRTQYETNGPYWNRVYGPVNVIHQSTRRDRGMQDGWNTPFTIAFHYSFRSFSGLSPKIVALDLISSFLNLTYNDAQFLGQLGRYFPRTGVKFDPSTTELIGDILTKWATSFESGSGADMMKLASTVIDQLKAAADQGISMMKDAGNGDLTKIKEAGSNVAQTIAISALAESVPKLISIRSALSDRPVGEWHLVVGNPLNPIMTMGDMICTSCDMAFDEEMGPDDFPTGVTFTVGLQQGKPRDKVAIERIFNLGETKMMSSKLRPFSSANDTFGEINNTEWSEKAKKSFTDLDEGDQDKLKGNTYINYRNRIRRAYGHAQVGDSKEVGENEVDDSILWMYYDRRQDKQ